MNKEVLKKLNEILEMIDKQDAKSRADKKLTENLTYWLKGQGIERTRSDRKSSLYQKQMKAAGKETTFRGSPQQALAERERKLALEAERKANAIKAEEVEEEADEDKQVLANSEEKPKRKRRTTRKKKEDNE